MLLQMHHINVNHSMEEISQLLIVHAPSKLVIESLNSGWNYLTGSVLICLRAIWCFVWPGWTFTGRCRRT